MFIKDFITTEKQRQKMLLLYFMQLWHHTKLINFRVRFQMIGWYC